MRKLPTYKGAKQGCGLAPTLFEIYFAYVFKTALEHLDCNTGVSVLSRDDGDFFNLARFIANTETHRYVIRELLHAADVVSSPDDLQAIPNSFSAAYYSIYGLTINLKKTVSMYQAHGKHKFTINDTIIANVDEFTYYVQCPLTLQSILSCQPC